MPPACARSSLHPHGDAYAHGALSVHCSPVQAVQDLPVTAVSTVTSNVMSRQGRPLCAAADAAAAPCFLGLCGQPPRPRHCRWRCVLAPRTILHLPLLCLLAASGVILLAHRARRWR